MENLVSENFEEFLGEDFEPTSDLEDSSDLDIWGEIDLQELQDPDDEKIDSSYQDELIKMFRNELLIPEFSRTPFKIISNGEEAEGIPMAELSTGDAFLFKINGQIKKIKLSDISINEAKRINGEDIETSYDFSDYLSEISDFIKEKNPDWEVILEDDDIDLIDWLERNQELWDLQFHFEEGTPAEEVAKRFM
jgi:hypothetical protein